MQGATRVDQTADSLNTRKIARVVGTTMVVCGALLIGITLYFGWSANEAEVGAERSRLDNAFNQSIATVLDQQRSVAWWDDAVVKVTQTFDQDFVDANFGIFLTETYGQDEIYILDSDDRPIYSHGADASVASDIARSHLDQVRDVVAGLRDNGTRALAKRPDAFLDRQSGYEKLGGVRTSANWFGAVLVIDGVPSIVAAITISPNVDPTILKGVPYLLVSIVRIDQAYLDNLSRSLLIPALKLDQSRASGPSIASQPFVADDGTPAGFLTWRSAEPGRPLLTTILPLVIALVVVMGFLSATMLKRLSRASSELARRAAAARFDALHDSLSSLPNRQAFSLEARRLIEASLGDPNARVLIGYLDIDRFKDINDTLGHHMGDELIRAFGQRLKAHLAADDFLARVGGDEFAILRRESRDDEKPPLDRAVAQAFAEPIVIEGHNLAVTASLGLATMPQHGRTPDVLMRHADIALYEAKRQGRDRTVSFTEAMAADLNERREIELHLVDAMSEAQMELYYQPVLNGSTGRIEGAEALVRWFHPTKGTIPPSVFIPIAEEAGLMPVLGEWVLRRAIAQSAQWPALELAINLSPAQFRHSDLARLLSDLVAEIGADPRRITLEITEGLLLDPSPHTRAMLTALREAGFRIALDDFGTGFSSLKYLMNFGFDKLKIDRSFVSGIADSESAKTIVQSVVQMGHALGMEIVAEGVETQAEHDIMQRLGCDHMQGYLFSRPLPSAGFTAFVASFNAAARNASGASAAKGDARNGQR